ncbi:GNAT superfamily N-acetyltransferase [Catenuloplanes nepalensis]|uniref:GNAT superfamily N-acetyltransferase n=1 Tax=Catenuloplanes nepalensis TaxID=587533 RepID=A0ABT9MR52_9ACTN|nr:GNAT family N-acetyltransferase [Catenuloplanes nepalensis]MDP9793914.1 GNAT superfamily N-acetyltransferase [Catenuloplanes nepalensis]
MTTTIVDEAFDGVDGVRLRAAMGEELLARFSDVQEREPVEPTAENVDAFVVARDIAGTAVGCGALRVLDDGTAEVKRMYVAPEARGTGASTAILRALEDRARERGVVTVQMATTVRQPEAVRFYEREGYKRIHSFGPYPEHPLGVYLAREID